MQTKDSIQLNKQQQQKILPQRKSLFVATNVLEPLLFIMYLNIESITGREKKKNI